jgi:RES domain-containing protein
MAGRWHSLVAPALGQGVVYASLSYGTALLETLVHHAFRRLPAALRFVRIEIPASVSRQKVDALALHGWDRPDIQASQSVGDAWRRAGASAILLVPSVPAPLDLNLVINLDHPDAQRIRVSAPMPIITDPRLRAPADDAR